MTLWWWWLATVVSVCADAATVYRRSTPTVREHDDMQRLYGIHQNVFNDVAVNGTVCVTMVTEGFTDFAQNALLHFSKALPQAKLLMVAYDEKSMDWCREQPRTAVRCEKAEAAFGLYCRAVDPNKKSARDYYFQANRLVQICRFAIVYYILKAQFSLLWLDTDSVLLRNPLPTIIEGGADWVGACHTTSNSGAGSTPRPDQLNIGVMFMRHGPMTRLVGKVSLFKMFYSAEGRRVTDQVLFTETMHKYKVKTRCLPHTEDGMSCNQGHWKPHWPSPAIWNLHAACTPRLAGSGSVATQSAAEKKVNKKRWLQHYNVWLAGPVVGNATDKR